jgi:23S rRNA (guanosine2251-2'-O)-methyltransferase
MENNRDMLIWGVHPILETLKTRPTLITEIFIQEKSGSGRLQEIVDLAAAHGIPVRRPARLPSPAGPEPVNHQGVLARLKSFPACELPDLIDDPETSEPTLVALDSIQDPHNLGAIIRSAAGAGATGVIIPKDRSAPLTGAAAKVAAGALNRIRICRVTNLADSLRQLKEAGYWIYGAEGGAGQSLFQAELRGKICLVIGSEGKGLRPLVRKHCDFFLDIPLAAGVESLNASVAAGVILFEIARQKALRTEQGSKLENSEIG